MKITAFETFVVRLPTRRRHTWASNLGSSVGTHLILRLDTDEGLSGWGEAPAIATWGGAHGAYYGETPGTVRHLIEEYLFPTIQARSPLDVGPLHAAMDRAVKGHPYAKAAVDCALYDLAGKASGLPVYALLGGQFRDRVAVCHSLGIMEVEDAVAEGERAAAEGITTIKVKCGVDPRRELAIVRELRRSLGHGVAIRVDANEGYRSAREAIRLIGDMDQYDILLAEQPVADLDAMAEIARNVSVPIMADESAWTRHDLFRIIEKRAAELISLYTTKPGGLYRAMQVAAVAEAGGIRSDIGGSIEMGIGNAANLHLGAAAPIAELASVLPASRPAEAYHGQIAGVYYLDDLLREPLEYADGFLRV
ncbi:MAG: mandelate racemase, partial [Planctomycetes bacterium]|nr:mandelate racemase [Planctomycetota bacterium]